MKQAVVLKVKFADDGSVEAFRYSENEFDLVEIDGVEHTLSGDVSGWIKPGSQDMPDNLLKLLNADTTEDLLKRLSNE